jgi:hypothetical protein
VCLYAGLGFLLLLLALLSVDFVKKSKPGFTVYPSPQVFTCGRALQLRAVHPLPPGEHRCSSDSWCSGYDTYTNVLIFHTIFMFVPIRSIAYVQTTVPLRRPSARLLLTHSTRPVGISGRPVRTAVLFLFVPLVLCCIFWLRTAFWCWRAMVHTHAPLGRGGWVNSCGVHFAHTSKERFCELF